MKLAVIVSEFGAAANVGGSVETTVKTFDMPPEVAEFIHKHKGQWTTISLGIEHDEQRPEVGHE